MQYLFSQRADQKEKRGDAHKFHFDVTVHHCWHFVQCVNYGVASTNKDTQTKFYANEWIDEWMDGWINELMN